MTSVLFSRKFKHNLRNNNVITHLILTDLNVAVAPYRPLGRGIFLLVLPWTNLAEGMILSFKSKKLQEFSVQTYP